MKKKITLAIGASLTMFCLLLVACIIDIPSAIRADPWRSADDGSYYDTAGQEVEGYSSGYSGSFITVYIRLHGGIITSFRFRGGYSMNYTNEINFRRPSWERTVLDSNSFDFPVVGSGATATLRGVRTAGRNALIDNFDSITADDFTIND